MKNFTRTHKACLVSSIKKLSAALFLLLFSNYCAEATVFFARTTGTWTPGTSTSTIFAITSCGTATSDSNPGSGDEIQVCSGIVLTVNGSGTINNLNLTTTTSKVIINSGFTLTVAGTYANSGTTTNGVNGPGTIKFNGAVTVSTLTPSGTNPNLNTNAAVIIGASLSVAALTVTSSTLTINSGFTLTMTGAFSNSGTVVGPGTLKFSSTSNSIPVGAGAGGTFSTSTPVSVTSNVNTVTVSATTTVATMTINNSSSTLSISGSTNLNVTGDWVNNGGTFTVNTSTVTFNSTTAAQAIKGTAATQTFNNITVNKSGKTLSISGSTTTLNVNAALTLTAGTLTISSGVTLDEKGAFSNSGNIVGPGTLKLTANNSIPLGGGAGGTLDATTPVNVTANATVTLTATTTVTNVTINSAKTLTTSGSPNLNVGGTWANNGGTFTPGTETVTFNKTSSTQTVDNGSSSFNNLTHSGAGTLQILNSNLTANGNITNSAGTLDANTLNITIGGNWSNTSTFTPSTGAVIFNAGAGTQTVDNNASSFNDLTHNGAGTLQLVTSNITVNGTITNSAGTLDANNLNITVGGNWTNSSTFTAGSGTVTFNNGATAQNVDNGASSFNNLTHSGGATLKLTNNLTANGNITNSAGTLNANNFNISLKGDWSLTSLTTFTAGSGIVTFNSTSANQSITGTAASQTFKNITINNNGFTLSVGGSTTTLTITNNLVITTGAFDIGTAAAINIGGDWTAASGTTFTPGSGTVTFNSVTADQNINGTAASQTFNNITVNKAGFIMGIAGSTATLTLNGILTLTAGTFDVSIVPTNINIAGDWTNNGGTFTPGTGTVTFNSAAADQNINGTAASEIFNNLTVDKSGFTLFFGGSIATVNVTSTLTVTNGTFDNSSQTIAGGGAATIVVSDGTTLILGGTTGFPSGFTTVTLGSISNVNYTGTDQLVGAQTYGNVFLDGSGTKTLAGVASFTDLTINSATTIFDCSNNDCTVNGNWTNSGTFTPGTATVTFGGTAAQSITGATAFTNLTVNNSGTATPVTASSAITITGVVDVNDGQLATGGLVTLISNAGGTASVANLSDGTPDSPPISGNVTAQRFINEATPYWYALASPFTDATFADWNADFFMTGFPGTDQPTNGFISVDNFDEVSDIYGGPAGTGAVIPNGADKSGWFCYIGTDGIGPTPNMPKTLDLTGTLQIGGLTVMGLTNTAANGVDAGFHFLGNPYSSPMNWSNIFANAGTTAINATASLLKGDGSGVYLPITAGVPPGTPPQVISSAEAFFVLTTGGGAVEFQEDDKDISEGDPYNAKTIPPLLSFDITLHRGTYTDAPAHVYFANSHLNIPVSTGYDPLLDAKKIHNFNGYENVATVVGNYNLVVNFIPDSVSQLTIPVRVWEDYPSNITKTYTLDFTNVALLHDNNKCITFEDTKAGISFPLTNDTSYTVTMQDTTYAARFFIHLSAPITSTVTNPTCSGSSNGFITAAGSGSGPFNYLWTNQGGDTIRNVSSSGADTIKNIGAGIYFLSVSNNGSCGTAGTHFELTEPVNPLSLSMNKTNVNCFGGNDGSATLTAIGGSLPYSYQWNTGGTQSAINNLQSAIYNVTVTDGNGCNKIDSVNISQPTQILANTTATDATCNGGSNGTAAAAAAGGSSPYSYLWNDTAATATAAAANLSAGNYMVTITDNNGCTKTSSATVSQPSAISISSSSTVATCGSSDGSASVTAGGGTSPYSYLWQGGSTQSAISNLPYGNYSVTVSDANSCSKTSSVTVNEVSGVNVSILSSTNISCNGGSNGQITVNANGGTPAYNYLWSNGTSGLNTSGLAAGTYTVTATDANGCAGTAMATINEPSALVVTSSGTNATCGNPDGSATVVVSGGTSGYSYSWSNGAQTQSIASLPAGSYFVLVTDANGCDKAASVNISNIGGPSVNVLSVTEPTCFGLNNGSATVTSTGNGPFTYLWENSNGDTVKYSANVSASDVMQNVFAGTYTVLVSDNNGCGTTTTLTIGQPQQLVAFFSSNDTIDIAFGQTTVLTNMSSGATSYQWDFGDGTTSMQFEPNHLYTAAGTYTITLTALQSSCSNTYQQTIFVINTTGIDEKGGRENISVKQISDKAFIQFNLDNVTRYQLALYNILGQETVTKTVNVKTDKIELAMPVVTGIYFLRISSAQEQFVYKLYRQ